MNKISITLDKKVNHLIWVLLANGFFLLVLAVLIVWTDFMLQLIMGLFAVVVAFVFLYSAYKLWHFKKILDKYIKF
jgi:divalent metal cation (Fe/Co/Zn/Cd) transporter